MHGIHFISQCRAGQGNDCVTVKSLFPFHLLALLLSTKVAVGSHCGGVATRSVSSSTSPQTLVGTSTNNSSSIIPESVRAKLKRNWRSIQTCEWPHIEKVLEQNLLPLPISQIFFSQTKIKGINIPDPGSSQLDSSHQVIIIAEICTLSLVITTYPPPSPQNTMLSARQHLFTCWKCIIYCEMVYIAISKVKRR